jgi:hypothetical protein
MLETLLLTQPVFSGPGWANSTFEALARDPVAVDLL